MAMRLWLVDHSYGAALVYAATKREAMDIGDALGDVRAVHPFTVPMAFSIYRVPAMEDEDGYMEIIANMDCEYEYDVDAVLAKHGVALNREEYEKMYGPVVDHEVGPR
jgi:hypothetical protein